MAATYTPIASVTLEVDTGSVTFNNIPSTYTDLVLVSKTSITGTSVRSLTLRFNSDGGNNYSHTRIYGDGTSSVSDRDSNVGAAFVGIIGNGTITSAGTFINNIMNYSNTTTNKTIISRSSDTASTFVSQYVSVWRSTAAITSVTVLGSEDNLRSGSTFNLYGILGANA
jgi:hypothetical protein